jgi:hypothetical protein
MAVATTNRAIMLSSAFAGFKEHRQVAIQAIKEAGCFPIEGEHLFEDAAALICILGARHHAFPADLEQIQALPAELDQNPRGLSLIELEFNEAQRRGLPIFVFDEIGGGYSDPRVSADAPRRLEAFRKRAMAEAHYEVFANIKGFYAGIRTALTELIDQLESAGNELGLERHFIEQPLESVKPAPSRKSAKMEAPAATPIPPENPKPPPSPAGPIPENLRTAPFYSDHAARSDLLNRKAVAETVATMIENVWREDDKEESIDRTFMVHLHGRWGSGKTSILNFLKDSLISQNSNGSTDKAADPSWIVIDYNAWRNQALGPAWWTMMETVYRQARQQLGGWWTESGQRLILRDRLWRLRSSYAPYALAAALLIALGLLLIFIWQDSVLGKGKSWIEEGIKFVVSVAGLIATVFAFGHSYPIGSARTAKSYLELSRDPLNPLIKRYGDLVEDVGRPVAVFIDDLDRCNAEFVVELLQTIQTLFRNARVLYVVAADRDWVCASYQQIYKSFNESIGEPGKSLGHLFVEKVFQLSVEVPRLNEQERNRYWEELIKSNLPVEPKVQQQLVDEATRAIENAETESRIMEIIDQYRKDPGVAQIVAAKAFRQMQAAPVERERQHFLSKYAPLIEPNPRAMKRLLNAYGFRRGFDIQSRHRSEADALVRWTILENRWPILADYLEGRTAGNDIIKALMKDKAVLEVANDLTWEKLRPVASAPDEPPKPETTPGTAKK